MHISTPFAFVGAAFIVGLIAVVFAFVRSMRNDRLEADVALERAKADAAYRVANPVRLTPDDIQRVHGERVEARQAVNGWPMGSYTHTFASAPSYAAAAPVYHSDPLTGLATGMLIGSALGHSHSHDTTIIHDNAPSHSHYSSDSSSYSSSSSSDSGFSYSDSSSSSSYDSGSSGGFDASW
jgi:hypothetical protein